MPDTPTEKPISAETKLWMAVLLKAIDDLTPKRLPARKTAEHKKAVHVVRDARERMRATYEAYRYFTAPHLAADLAEVAALAGASSTGRLLQALAPRIETARAALQAEGVLA